MSDDEKQARKEKLFEEHGLDIQHATRNGLALAYGVSQSTLKRAIKLAREGKKGSVQGRPRNGGSPSKQRKCVTTILAAKENGKGFLESDVSTLLIGYDKSDRRHNGRLPRQKPLTKRVVRDFMKQNSLKTNTLESTPQSRLDASADIRNHITNAAVIRAASEDVPLKLLVNFDAKKVPVQVIKFMLIINVYIIHVYVRVHALVYSLSWTSG